MCLECGCGTGGEHERRARRQAEMQEREHGPAHGPGEEGERGPDNDNGPAPGEEHEHDHEHGSRTIPVHQSVLAKNDRLAERNRGYFQAKGLLVLNMVSAPGSGKTTFIEKTAKLLTGRLRTGVIVGDLATDNDAARLRAAEVPVVQITTGTVCHLEAEMVARAMAQLELDALDMLIIENVGNLVCPAVYDLGEDLRIVLLSTTEGEDKPLKYPPMFHSADVAVVTKMDLADAAGFARQTALKNLHQVSHHATVFELSARTGQGMKEWGDFLVEKQQRIRGKSRSTRSRKNH